MLLAIDAGNTNVVFAVYDGEAPRGSWRSSTDPRRTADEYAVWLTQLMGLEGLAPGDIDHAIIASVVPAVLPSLKTLCQRYFGVAPALVGDPELGLGIEVLIDRPEQVGADRLVNAVAAYARFGGPLVIIDFGTATTFDVIDRDGNYRGGVIAPGVNLSVEALYMAAAQLPRISVEPPATVIGSATVPAMQSGVYWGYVGLIEGLVSRITTEHGEPLTVVATGGLASLFAAATPVIQHIDPQLTLRGLMLIHRRNAGA
jgi:type III pantothenate kinase